MPLAVSDATHTVLIETSNLNTLIYTNQYTLTYTNLNTLTYTETHCSAAYRFALGNVFSR